MAALQEVGLYHATCVNIGDGLCMSRLRMTRGPDGLDFWLQLKCWRQVIQDMLEHPADSEVHGTVWDPCLAREVQTYGCAVISALCKRGFQDFAVEKGALEALVAALKAHPEAQRRACLALQHLLQGTAAAARRNKALEVGAVEALLATPRHALGALGALGVSSKALRRMVDGKVVAMFLEAMRDERTAPEAVKALAALASALAECAPEEFNLEMKKVLGALSARGPGVGRRWVEGASVAINGRPFK